jgi:hypothetical protein
MSMFLFVNFYNTTLSASATSTATTLSVTSATGLPTLAAEQIIPLALTPASSPGSVYEIVYVTAISGTTLTVTRGAEGTTAQNWNSGDLIACTPTAKTNASVRAALQPISSETLPVGNEIVVLPGTLAADATFTLPTGENIPAKIRIYGSASAFTVTVNTTVSTGSPFIHLPDGSEVYSWVIPASSPSAGIECIWDGTNWKAETFGQTVVSPAIASNQAVQQGQVLNTQNLVGATNFATSATAVSATTATFTAPSNGYAYIMAFAGGNIYNTYSGSSMGITASLGAVTSIVECSFYTNQNVLAILPMTQGQASTFTGTFSNNTSAEFSISIWMFFVPLP